MKAEWAWKEEGGSSELMSWKQKHYEDHKPRKPLSMHICPIERKMKKHRKLYNKYNDGHGCQMSVQLTVILTGVNRKAGCQSLPMSKRWQRWLTAPVIATVVIELTWGAHDGGHPNLLLMTSERHIPCSQHCSHSEQMEHWRQYALSRFYGAFI